MTVQPNLLGQVEPPKLGPRQQLVLDHIREHGPLTADEAGALVHEARGRHSIDSRCDWCAREGRGVLASLRSRGLLVRRRTGLWELRRGVAPSSFPAPGPASSGRAAEAVTSAERPDDALSFGDWMETL